MVIISPNNKMNISKRAIYFHYVLFLDISSFLSLSLFCVTIILFCFFSIFMSILQWQKAKLWVCFCALHLQRRRSRCKKENIRIFPMFLCSTLPHLLIRPTMSKKKSEVEMGKKGRTLVDYLRLSCFQSFCVFMLCFCCVFLKSFYVDIITSSEHHHLSSRREILIFFIREIGVLQNSQDDINKWNDDNVKRVSVGSSTSWCFEEFNLIMS